MKKSLLLFGLIAVAAIAGPHFLPVQMNCGPSCVLPDGAENVSLDAER